MTRRQFVKSSLLASLGLLTGGTMIAGLHPCVVNRQKIFMRGLPPAFDGIRVALLSDFHHGELVSAEMIRDAVRLTNSLLPDLIALPGDFIHRGKEWAADCFRELSALRAPLGVFGVLGNHDHYRGAASSVRMGMERAGITDLTNCGINLSRMGQTLRVCGVGDLWKERQKLGSALGATGRPDSVLLLSHNPDYAEHLLDERVGLMLSGHTHGGQCVLPFFGAPILPSRYGQKYASGLCRGPVAKVFVTTGVGHSFPPIRINCPAEVALLTLTSAGPYQRLDMDGGVGSGAGPGECGVNFLCGRRFGNVFQTPCHREEHRRVDPLIMAEAEIDHRGRPSGWAHAEADAALIRVQAELPTAFLADQPECPVFAARLCPLEDHGCGGRAPRSGCPHQLFARTPS